MKNNKKKIINNLFKLFKKRLKIIRYILLLSLLLYKLKKFIENKFYKKKILFDIQ